MEITSDEKNIHTYIHLYDEHFFCFFFFDVPVEYPKKMWTKKKFFDLKIETGKT